MIAIRPATVADVPTIHRLIRALAEYEKLPVEPELSDAALREHLFGSTRYAEALIAALDGADVGFALYFTTYSTFKAKPGLYLEDLFVEPEHRGRGIGKLLLNSLARVAVERNYAYMQWAVLDWNTPSIAFYDSLGAKPVDGWIAYRLSGDAMAGLAQKVGQDSILPR
jgi:GNAT superfamily N-acetyltransferase